MEENHPDRTEALQSSAVALLFSGGLDSCCLLSSLLRQGLWVQPLYVRCGMSQEREELLAAVRILRATRSSSLGKLVTTEVSLRDLEEETPCHLYSNFGPHQLADPLENRFASELLVMSKAALWSQLQGIETLMVAARDGYWPLSRTSEYLLDLQQALFKCSGRKLSIRAPFSGLDRRRTLDRSLKKSLDLSFSCTSPIEGLHCGVCPKCVDRRFALSHVGWEDKTRYADAIYSN